MAGVDVIRISNFKAFAKLEEIQLDGKNLLVYGENGSGKSSIYWSLYTLLQASIPGKETDKYFTAGHKENLLNVHNPPNNAYIEVEIDGNSYTLDATGLTPMAGGSPDILGEINLASDFISHRLLINFYNYRNKQRINLWPVFERDILPFVGTPENHALPMDSLYKAVADSENLPYEGNSTTGRVIIKGNDSGYRSRIRRFNSQLRRLVDDINLLASQFYTDHFNNGIDDFRVRLVYKTDGERVAGDPWYFMRFGKVTDKREADGVTQDFQTNYHKLFDPFIEMVLERKEGADWIVVDRPQSFLNEAKLTALALSVRFSILERRVQDNENKILVLDDLLVSLDMSNRQRVIDIILEQFLSDYQLMIFTHDRAFFEIAKRKIKFNYNSDDWKYLEMYDDTVKLSDGRTVPHPKILKSKSNFAFARYHFKSRDFAASANYMRKAFEERFIETLPARYQRGNNGRGRITMLHGLMLKAHEYYNDIGWVTTSVINEIDELKTILMNPLSHHNLFTDVYKVELENLFEAYNKLEGLRNEIIVPVNQWIRVDFQHSSGSVYRFHLKLNDDIRLLKEGAAVSVWGKFKTKTFGCEETTNTGTVVASYNFQFDNGLRTVSELVTHLSAFVVRQAGPAAITLPNHDEMLFNAANQPLSTLKRY